MPAHHLSLTPALGSRTPRRRAGALPTIAAMLMIGLAGTANAQNALGDGTALDANTGQNGPRNYQRPDFASELRFRNAIATGNAPGGLSFRGDLGYRAAGEFSGDLGSDSLFAFRRDSLYSGLAGMGIRGTDALQYQFALTTGAAPPRNLAGNLSLARDDYYNPSQYTPNGYSSGQSSRDSMRNSGAGSRIGFDRVAADLNPVGKQLSAPLDAMPGVVDLTGDSMLGSLRSSSTYTTTSMLQPAIMSRYTEGVDRKPIGLVSSPLLGITSTPMAQPDRAINPLVARPGNAPSGEADTTTPGGIPSTKLVTSYDALVEQMRTHVETIRTQNQTNADSTIIPGESNDAWLIRKMQDIREKLYGVKPANEGDPNDPNNPNADPNADESTDPFDPYNQPKPGEDDQSKSADPYRSIPNSEDSPVTKRLEDSLRGINSDPTGVSLYDPTEIAVDPETLEVLRGAAANEVKLLLDPGADKRDVYAEHMLAGQRLMADGRFFDAEERFTHALSIRPGDIPSQLGRFHAQIGAGMVLSASVNLQALMSMHPEIIASRYTGKLIPADERIEQLVARLKERAGLTAPKYSTRQMESEQVRVSASLLLAYIGYQVNDQQAINDGLAVVKELGSDTDRRFASLLAKLWVIPTEQPASDPAGTPQAD
jgi:hypothetical protein